MLPSEDKYIRQNKKRRTRRRIVSTLACLVALVTAYMLILPAVTMEQTPQCGVTAHEHGLDCYTPQTVCGFEAQDAQQEADAPAESAHIHTDECFREVLTCAEEAHTHTPECFAAPAAQVQEAPESDAVNAPAADETSVQAEPADPIDVSGYIRTATLYYRTDSASDWIEVTAESVLPGTAELKLAANYADVPLSDLMASGGVLQCRLPALLRDPTADNVITDEDGESIGTSSVTDGLLTIRFNEDWLLKQESKGVTLISGSFYAASYADLSAIGEDGNVEFVMGKVTIRAHFEDDIAAKNGTVAVSKVVSPRLIETEDGDFAEYELTVKAGADGCPAVRVVDGFTANGSYAAYDGVGAAPVTLTSTGSPGETVAVGKAHGTVCLNEAGGMVWQIGDMAPNETRTLRYRVRMAEGYSFLQNGTNGVISNEAQAYAAQYPKDSDTADLTPTAGLDLKKTSSEPVSNGDGSYTITYTVVCEANKNNAFTLKNVRLTDCLNDPENPTAAESLEFIAYDEASLCCYGGAAPTGTPWALTPVFSADGKGFEVVLGDLAPGKALCVQYRVRVGQEALIAAGGQQMYINNAATAFSDNARKDDQDYLGKRTRSTFLQYKNWAKKLAGEPAAADVTVPIGGAVYDATGDVPVLMTDAPESFTAPAGSYLYTVTVNDLGDWDVTSAGMTDRMDGTYMQFVGYVRVEALDTRNGNAVVDTRWVKVDGCTDFHFTLSQLGISDNRYAYRMSYYAEPKTIDGTAAVVARNSFTLSGTVVPGTGEPFTLTGVTVEAKVTLKGSNNIEAVKLSWYYEGPAKSVGNYGNGTLYWVIRVSGDAVRAGTYIQDYLQTGSHYSYIRMDSFVGAYTSALTGDQLTHYNDLNDLLASGKLTPVDESYYSVETLPGAKTQDTSTITVKMERTLPLDGENLYLIVKTAPAFLPPHPWFGNPLWYYNYLRTSDDGQNWTERGRADKILYEGTNVLKTCETVFKYNGESIQETVNGNANTIVTDALPEPGLYVSWNVAVNRAGDLSGRYHLEDTLPAGTELAYVRLLSRGNQAKAAFVPQSTGPGAGFTERSLTAKPQGETAEITTWYYTDGNTVRWDVDGLVAGKTENAFKVTFQIVCRVTDPAVLLGGEERTLNNQVTLTDEQGAFRDTDAEAATVSTRTLTKTVKEGGRTLPFTITVNALGEDLLRGADTLVIVDTLSSTLQLDPLSITVVDSKTQEAVPFDASVADNTLRIVVPDGRALTVRYNARVLAKPGRTVGISNDAHWEGYATTDGSSVEIEGYSYDVGGTAGGSATPRVEILKYDSASVTTRLPGAEFEMTEGSMANGVFTPTEGRTWAGTTDAQGVLKFGDETLMRYNTVYRIVETKAPPGFVRDDTPIYFLVAKADDNKTYPDYPDGVEVWYESDTFECRVGNGRGEAVVTKVFEDMGQDALPVVGTYTFGLYDTENPTGAPMQTATITFAAGQTVQNTAKFTNLELGKRYYIYELNDAGRPIRDGVTAMVDGKRFSVRYTSGPEVVIPEGGAAAVTVTNSVSYPELPETGGTGTERYTALGLLLSASALLLLWKRRRRAKQ